MAREWTRKSIEELARSVYARMGGGGSSTHVVPYTFGRAQGGPLSSGDWNRSGVFDGSNVVDPAYPITFLDTQYMRYYNYYSNTLPTPILQMGYRQNDYPYQGYSCFKGGEIEPRELVSAYYDAIYEDPEYWFMLSAVDTNYVSSLTYYLQNLSTAATTFLGHSMAHFTEGHRLAIMTSSSNIGLGITIPVVIYGTGSSRTVKVYAYNKNAVLKELSRGYNLEVYDSNNNIVGLYTDHAGSVLYASNPYIWLPTDTTFLPYLQHITADWSNTTPRGIAFLEVPSNCWGEMTVEEIVNKIFEDFPILATGNVTIDSYI